MPRRAQQVCNLGLTEDVRDGPRALATKYPGRQNLMTRVFGSHEAGKPSDGLQPVMPLGFCVGKFCPVYRRRGDHPPLPALGGKPRKAPQVTFDGGEGKACGTTHGQVVIDVVHEHGSASGHALATSWSSAISTLA